MQASSRQLVVESGCGSMHLEMQSSPPPRFQPSGTSTARAATSTASCRYYYCRVHSMRRCALGLALGQLRLRVKTTSSYCWLPLSVSAVGSKRRSRARSQGVGGHELQLGQVMTPTLRAVGGQAAIRPSTGSTWRSCAQGHAAMVARASGVVRGLEACTACAACGLHAPCTTPRKHPRSAAQPPAASSPGIHTVAYIRSLYVVVTLVITPKLGTTEGAHSLFQIQWASVGLLMVRMPKPHDGLRYADLRAGEVRGAGQNAARRGGRGGRGASRQRRAVPCHKAVGRCTHSGTPMMMCRFQAHETGHAPCNPMAHSLGPLHAAQRRE